MQKLLDDNDILMCLTHNEGKSVVNERFIRTLKGKIYELMTANSSKYYLRYLNKLVDKYNNSHHSSVGKTLIYVDYSALTEEIETNHKAPKIKSGDRVMITKYKNTFSKCFTEKWSK